MERLACACLSGCGTCWPERRASHGCLPWGGHIERGKNGPVCASVLLHSAARCATTSLVGAVVVMMAPGKWSVNRGNTGHARPILHVRHIPPPRQPNDPFASYRSEAELLREARSTADRRSMELQHTILDRRKLTHSLAPPRRVRRQPIHHHRTACAECSSPTRPHPSHSPATQRDARITSPHPPNRLHITPRPQQAQVL